jgi:hypothetical protein
LLIIRNLQSEKTIVNKQEEFYLWKGKFLQIRKKNPADKEIFPLQKETFFWQVKIFLFIDNCLLTLQIPDYQQANFWACKYNGFINKIYSKFLRFLVYLEKVFLMKIFNVPYLEYFGNCPPMEKKPLKIANYPILATHCIFNKMLYFIQNYCGIIWFLFILSLLPSYLKPRKKLK